MCSHKESLNDSTYLLMYILSLKYIPMSHIRQRKSKSYDFYAASYHHGQQGLSNYPHEGNGDFLTAKGTA